MHDCKKQQREKIVKASGKIFWLNVVFLIAITLNLRAPITSLGPIIESIKDAYNINSALGGLLTSLPLIAFGSVSFLVAYFSPMRAIVVGIVLIIIGEMYRSFGGSAGLFVGMALLGSGIAIANVLLPSFVKEKFPRKIPFMMGVYSLVLNLSGIFGIVFALPLLAFLGLQYSLLFWLPFALLAFFVYIPQMRNGRLFRTIKKQKSNINIFTQISAWKITLFMGAQSFVAYAMFAWLALIVSEMGYGSEFGANILLLAQAIAVPIGFIGPVILGKLKNAYRTVYMACLCGLYVVGFACLIWLDSKVGVVFGAICIGIPMGGVFAIALLFISTKSANSLIASKLSSMAQGFGYLIASTAPFIIGLLHDYFERFSQALYLLLIMGVIVSILGLIAYRAKMIE